MWSMVGYMVYGISKEIPLLHRTEPTSTMTHAMGNTL